MKLHVQRLKALGLTEPLAVKLSTLFSKWLEASGPEWTVKRLKLLKVGMINYIAGRDVDLPWVARNSDNIPKGVIGELYRLGKRGTRGRFLAINSLMIYSSLVSQSITASQREKFYSSMKSGDKTGLTSVSKRSYKIGFIQHLGEGRPWSNIRLSSRSFQPGPDGKSYPETDSFISLAAAVCSTPIYDMIVQFELFTEVIPVQLVIDLRGEGALAKKYAKNPVNLCVGKISYIQEPGFKLRAVANPNRVLQAALEPLKEALGTVLRNLSNDFTFDQASGVRWVRRALESGKIVHSIDLSDATNLFPLNYTIDVLLRRIAVPVQNENRYTRLVALFAKVARSPWFSKENNVIETHVFTRGQPLGLGPSFFAFALSHNVLLMDICKQLGVDQDCYAILGDDIVISDAAVAVEYRNQLSLMGCKIAMEKSITSNIVAEFAGKLIFRDAVIPQFKWRDLSDSNVVDFIRNVGPSGFSLLSPRQSAMCKQLIELPDYLGGLGWNPDGKTLDERLESPLAKFLLERDLRVLLPFRRVDMALWRLVSDERLSELIPKHIYVDGTHSVIPTREHGEPRWGSFGFWYRFNDAQKFGALGIYPEFITADEKLPTVLAPWKADHLQHDGAYYARLLYDPSEKEITNPAAQKATPWFDIIRLFERTQPKLS